MEVLKTYRKEYMPDEYLEIIELLLRDAKETRVWLKYEKRVFCLHNFMNENLNNGSIHIVSINWFLEL